MKDPVNELSCNLRFINADLTIDIKDNIATVSVGYFVENAGSMNVTDVFNAGTLTFPRDFVVDNIITDNDMLTITKLPGQILYNGNLGTLVPGETILVDLSFDIIGVVNIGEFLISNISNIMDGQDDDINFAKVLELNVAEIKRSVNFADNAFNFSITNNSAITIDVNILTSITLPANVAILFRDFGAFVATYANTELPVPTNTELSGVNTIDLSSRMIAIQPYSSVVLPVPFELSSSNQLGEQFIYAAIEDLSINMGNNNIILLEVLPSESNSSVALVRLQLTPVMELS